MPTPMRLPTGPTGGRGPRHMMLAALTSLAHRHGEAVTLVGADRLDPAFLDAVLAGLDEASGLVGCFLRGTLGPCGPLDPAHAPLLLAAVDVDRSSAAPPGTSDASVASPSRLGDLGDAQLEVAVRQLGWVPRICGNHPTAVRTALEWARHEIRVLQATAREGIVPSRVAWPVVLVRSSRSPGPVTGGNA